MGGGVQTERTATAIEEARNGAGGRARAGHRGSPHDKGLLLIGFFKLVEAVFFVAVGMGVLHFLHRDLGDAVLSWTTKLRMDPEGRMVNFLLDRVDSITDHRLKQIGVATFLYAAIRVAEGVGLVMEKLWAEYLTIGVTSAFLPWEMYEIVREVDAIRVGLFVINLAVLGYLVWQLRRKRVAETQVAD
jgi:uncharacterized membrane protein (DUF2068 family)